MMIALSPDAALELFATHYGRGQATSLTAAERATVQRLASTLHFHPLAIELAAANAAYQHRPLEELADDLEQDSAQLGNGGDDVGAVYLIVASSYASLAKDAQQAFTALGAFTAADVGYVAACALTQALQGQTNEASVYGELEQIVHLHLAERYIHDEMPVESDRHRLRMHEIVQSYARNLLATWEEGARTALSHTLADWYARYVHAADVTALGVDAENLTGAAEWAYSHHDAELLVALCSGLMRFWRDRGQTDVSLRLLPPAITAAERLLGERPDAYESASANAPEVVAWIDRARLLFGLVFNLGAALEATGHSQEAHQQYQRALALARQVTLQSAEGMALGAMGHLAIGSGRLTDAEHYYGQALHLHRAAEDREEIAVDLANLGQIAQLRSDLDMAERYYTESLSINRELQARRLEGVDLVQLGQVAELRGNLEVADRYYKESLAIMRHVHDRESERVILSSLGALALRRGQGAAAVEYERQALTLTAASHMPDNLDAEIFFNLAEKSTQLGLLDDAQGYYRQCRAIAHELTDPMFECAALANLGVLALEVGDTASAAQCYAEGVNVLPSVPDENLKGIALANLAALAEAVDGLDAATRLFSQALLLAKALGNRTAQGPLLSNLGRVAMRQGLTTEAEHYFVDALPLAREQDNREAVAFLLGRLGRLTQQQDRFQDAARYYQDALPILRELDDRQEEAVTLIRLARMAEGQGRFDAAEQYLRETLALVRSASGARGQKDEAIVALALGELLVERQHKREEGCALLRLAIQIRQDQGLANLDEAIQTAQRLGCLP